MRIIYTRKAFATMPKADKINIIRTSTTEAPGATFWDRLKAFKNKIKAGI